MYYLNKLLLSNLIIRRYSTHVLSVKEILSTKYINKEISVQGWVQSIRKQKNLCFMDIIDGSCLERLQVVVDDGHKCDASYGCSVKVQGKLVASSHKGQLVELQCPVNQMELIGTCSEDYPFCNRLKYSSEYIRSYPHLRPRTRTFGSVLRLRSSATSAVHRFFQSKGFQFLHTPILTMNDCEGAGEVFTVQAEKRVKGSKSTVSPTDNTSNEDSSDSGSEDSSDSESEDSPDSGNENKTPEMKDPKEFFGHPVYLSGSAQLHLEAAACALSRVYTFGPVFRTEGKHSRVHACEFQMIEAEMAFIESIEDLTKLVEESVKQVAQSLMNECSDEISWIYEKNDAVSENYIMQILDKPFIQMPYSEAVDILRANSKSLIKNMEFGEDFLSEHKYFLVKHCNNIPVFITMIPGAISPFYMKVDEKGMAYCFDVLAPFGGEICSGSLRENSESIMGEKLKGLGLQDSLSWYLDLCKYGPTPHGGFGIGFDRLLQTLLRIKNIRDVIAFPRRWNDCKC